MNNISLKTPPKGRVFLTERTYKSNYISLSSLNSMRTRLYFKFESEACPQFLQMSSTIPVSHSMIQFNLKRRLTPLQATSNKTFFLPFYEFLSPNYVLGSDWFPQIKHSNGPTYYKKQMAGRRQTFRAASLYFLASNKANPAAARSFATEMGPKASGVCSAFAT